MNSKKVMLDISPLGDLVMMSAVAKALQLIGWEPAIRVPDVALGMASMLGVPVIGAKGYVEGAAVVIMGDYLNYDTHFDPLPDGYHSDMDMIRLDSRGNVNLGHLCHWMAVHAATVLGIKPFVVEPDDAKFLLSEDQIADGKQLLRSQVGGEKPIVLFSVAAGSQNRVLPPEVILEAILLLGEEFQAALLTPLPGIPGFTEIQVPNVKYSLEQLPSVLIGADAVVSTDSGPYHIAAAAIQGSPTDPKKLILACGSSNPFTLLYEGNQFVEAPRSACPVIPCGRHGYGDTVPLRMKGHELFEIKKSLCIYPGYTATGLAPCMRAVSAEQIVQKVRIATE